MFAFPRILSILTTRRCTAACDHCCVGASPRATAAIPVARIHGLIDEATRVPSLHRIVFTGGECFLLGKDLDALVSHAHDAGFGTRVITNGYWAVSAAAARTRLHALHNAGLDEIMLSTGDFHQRFVPVQRIVHAAQAAAAEGLGTRISVEECDQSDFDGEYFREELQREIAAGSVCIASSAWIADAGGRSQTVITHGRTIADRAPMAAAACDQIMTVISVTPNQMLTACCGFPMEELPQLHIGSIADRPLDEVLRDAPNELMKMWLHVAGPAGIAEFVARYIPGFRLEQTASICQSCVALQRDDAAMRVLAAHGAEIAQQIAAEFAHRQLAPA